MDKQFEKLLSGIRTEEVRTAIASVRSWCGRRMLVLSILVGIALLGVGVSHIVLNGAVLPALAGIPVLEQDNEALQSLVNRVGMLELKQVADSSTLGVLHWEYEQRRLAAFVPTLVPTPEPATPAPVEGNARQVLGNLYGGYYDPMWEYLEYGETAEYFRPVEVTLSWMEGDSSNYKSFLLTPPQWRALEQKLKDRKWEYSSKFEVYFEGDTLQAVFDPETGNLIWDASMAKGPRPLNNLEQWYMDYITFNGWDLAMEDDFDTLPECEKDRWGSERCENIEGWSPAEIAARGIAFANHANNPENGVWVEQWQSVDAQYRWVDAESGEALPLVTNGGWRALRALPKSGWLELQVGEKFAPTARFRTYPGFLACIDQAAQICQAGSLGWRVWGYEWMAYQTSEVLEEDLMRELSSFYGEALKYEKGFYPYEETVVFLEGYKSATNVFLVKGEFEKQEVASAIEQFLRRGEGNEGVYVVAGYLHFFDPDNGNVARWLDSRSEFAGWRDLKEDVRAMVGSVEVEKP